MQGVTKEFARGYFASVAEIYPSDDLRLVDFNTKEVVLEQRGNGETHHNTTKLPTISDHPKKYICPNCGKETDGNKHGNCDVVLGRH